MAEKLHDAFISYSRKDSTFASLLKKALEAFSPPKIGTIPQKHLDIFRDEEDFTGTDYHKAVSKHLQTSRKLIVICSPAARASQYVNDEIRVFTETNGSEHIIPILLDGLPNNEATEQQEANKAFPDALINCIQMPRAIDYRGFQTNRDKVNKGKFNSSWFDLLTHLYDTDRNLMEERERKRQVRNRNLWIGGMGSVIVILSAFLGLAVFNWFEAEQAKDKVELSELVVDAENKLINDPQLSLLISLSAVLQIYPSIAQECLRDCLTSFQDQDKEIGLNAESILHKALQIYRTRYVLEPNIHGLWSVSFSPDGKYLAAGGVKGIVKLWKLDASSKNWIELGLLKHTKEVRSVAFSPDSKYLATASYDNIVRLWDIESSHLKYPRKPKEFPIKHNGKVRTVSFSPNGQWLASGGEDNIVILWDIKLMQKVKTLSDHTGAIWAVSFSADGKKLASASKDKTTRIWNIENIEQVNQPLILYHNDTVTGVAFGPDGKILATSSSDNTVRIYDIENDIVNNVTILSDHTSSIWAIAFSPDGNLLATTSNNGETKVWERSSTDHYDSNSMYGNRINYFTPVFSFVGQGRGIGISFGYKEFDRVLATASDDGTIRMWNLDPKLELLAFEGHTQHVWDVTFTNNDNLLITVSDDRTIKFWDSITGEMKHSLNYEAPIRALSLDQLGRKLATSSTDGSVNIWDISNYPYRKLQNIQGHSDRGVGISLSRSGKILATSTNDNNVILWDPVSGELIKKLETKHGGFVYSLAFSHADDYLVTGSDDKSIEVWDVINGNILKDFYSAHSAPVRTVTFSPNDRLLASAGADGLIKVWDLNDGGEVLSLEGHSGEIHKLNFSSDGKRIASGGHDGTIRIWNIDNGNLELTLNYPGSVLSLNFSQNGQRIAVAGKNKVVQLFTLDIGKLADLAINKLSQANDPLVKNSCRRYLSESICISINK